MSSAASDEELTVVRRSAMTLPLALPKLEGSIPIGSKPGRTSPAGSSTSEGNFSTCHRGSDQHRSTADVVVEIGNWARAPGDSSSAGTRPG